MTAPLVTPLADVDVLYDVTAPGNTSGGAGTAHPLQQRMRWRAEGWLQRIDPAESATFMITDYRAGRLSVVDDAHRVVSVMEVPLTQLAPPGRPAPGVWVRGGAEQVAGTTCADWTGRDSDGGESTFCYTADGVLLKAFRGGRLLLQATRVVREGQPAALFAVPAAYRVLPPASR